MNPPNVEILLVTRSLALQQGLTALLESLPGISRVQALRELPEAVSWIAAHLPRLILLDAALLGAQAEAVLAHIRDLSRMTQRVLLVDDLQAVRFMPAYAEAILIKGTAPTAVTAIITNLLSSQEGVDHEHSNPDA